MTGLDVGDIDPTNGKTFVPSAALWTWNSIYGLDMPDVGGRLECSYRLTQYVAM